MLPFTPRRRRLGAAVAALALVAATGCGSDDNSDSDGGQEPDQVTYLTSFQASAHDAFIFLAEERGYFDDAGIDLTIELGAGSQNYPPLLAGQAQFTYTDLTGLLVSIGRGDLAPTDFRALAAVHQQTLVAIVAPEDAGITSPADLEGKTIGAFAGSPTETLLPAYAELSGWEYDDDLIVRTGAGELFGTLASGQVDLLSTFIIQRGVIESIIGQETTVLPFNDHLDDVLGTGLITSATLAEEDPDLVQRFRDAAMQGLNETLDSPEEAVRAMQSVFPEAVQDENVDPFVGQIGVMEPYITAYGEDRIGVLDEQQVIRGISVLVGAGVIPEEIQPEAIIGDLTLLTS